VAVAGRKSQTNMSKVWMRVDYLKLLYCRRFGPKCGGCGLGSSKYSNMFQADWSKMWRLRVENCKLMCCRQYGPKCCRRLSPKCGGCGFESQTTIICFRRFGSKCGGCGLGISNYNNMFQAVWSEMWRLRVENCKLLYFRRFSSKM
jgi:hypothetical protein